VAPPTIPKKHFLTIMTKTEKIEKLERDLAWWTAKLNKSRKNSLRAMRALHANAIRQELDQLKAG